MAGPSGATARLALPYPIPTDTADVPRDVQGLAAALDPLIAVAIQGTAATRPAAGTAGRLYFATDTQTLSYDTGSAWVAISQPEAAGSIGFTWPGGGTLSNVNTWAHGLGVNPTKVAVTGSAPDLSVAVTAKDATSISIRAGSPITRGAGNYGGAWVWAKV